MLRNLSKGLISIKSKIDNFSNINEIIAFLFKKKINHLLNQYSKVIDTNVASVKIKSKYNIENDKNYGIKSSFHLFFLRIRFLD